MDNSTLEGHEGALCPNCPWGLPLGLREQTVAVCRGLGGPILPSVDFEIQKGAKAWGGPVLSGRLDKEGGGARRGVGDIRPEGPEAKPAPPGPQLGSHWSRNHRLDKCPGERSSRLQTRLLTSAQGAGHHPLRHGQDTGIGWWQMGPLESPSLLQTPRHTH